MDAFVFACRPVCPLLITFLFSFLCRSVWVWISLVVSRMSQSSRKGVLRKMQSHHCKEHACQRFFALHVLQGGLDRYSRFIFDLTTALLMYLTFRSNIFLYACSINATVHLNLKQKEFYLLGWETHPFDWLHVLKFLNTVGPNNIHSHIERRKQ